MTDTAIHVTDPVVEPTEPGWYASAADGLGDYLIYLRRDAVLLGNGEVIREAGWMALTRDGGAASCQWGYIAQAGPITRLIKQPGAIR